MRQKKGKAQKNKSHYALPYKTLKEVGENGRQPRPNGLVVSAGKCAAPMAAENCTSCKKSIRLPSILYMDMLYYPHEVRFSVTYWRSQFSGCWHGY